MYNTGFTSNSLAARENISKAISGQSPEFGLHRGKGSSRVEVLDRGPDEAEILSGVEKAKNEIGSGHRGVGRGKEAGPALNPRRDPRLSFPLTTATFARHEPKLSN